MLLFSDARLYTESLVALLLLAVSCFAPRSVNQLLNRAMRLGRARLHDRVLISCFLLAVSVGSALGIAWAIDYPPQVNDEVSYLLGADTFVQGRFTNPSHPLADDFETYHVIQHPTYVSKFPPGQALFLAAGTVLFGKPIFGVLLSAVFAIAALLWMLQGWMTFGWAAWGTWLAIVQWVIFSYWSQTYWGGFVAMGGGALVAGAFGRLVRHESKKDTLVLCLGLLTLAHTRPFEGGVLSVVFLFFLMQRGWQREVASRRAWFHCVAPLLVVCGAGIILSVVFYQWKVIGNAWESVHSFYERTHNTGSLFIWEKIASYPNEMKRLGPAYEPFVRIEETWLQQRAHLTALVSRLIRGWSFYLGPLLGIAALALPVLWKRERLRPVFFSLFFLFAAECLVNWYFPHYTAPAACLFVLLTIQGFRVLRITRWRGHRPGRMFVWAIPAAQFVSLLAATFLFLRHAPHDEWWVAWQPFPHFKTAQRRGFERKLRAIGGKHLVVVRYSADYEPPEDFVFNAADIDRSQIVWARYLDDTRLPPLLNYFRDRKPWLCSVGNHGAELTPLSRAR